GGISVSGWFRQFDARRARNAGVDSRRDTWTSRGNGSQCCRCRPAENRMDCCRGVCLWYFLDYRQAMESRESSPKLISVIIPVLDEAESLGQLADELRVAAETHHLPIEVIFVDDGSRDDSW